MTGNGPQDTPKTWGQMEAEQLRLYAQELAELYRKERELRQEVVWVMEELRRAGCHFLTLGQYLQPSPHHLPVVRFVPPEEFAGYQALGTEMGFRGVAAGPLVRSSFHAASLLHGTG